MFTSCKLKLQKCNFFLAFGLTKDKIEHCNRMNNIQIKDQQTYTKDFLLSSLIIFVKLL